MSLQDFRFSSFFPQKDGVLVIRERLLHPKFGIKWMNFLDISSSKMASCQPWEGLSSRETDKQLVYIRDDGNRKMDTEKRIIKKKTIQTSNFEGCLLKTSSFTKNNQCPNFEASKNLLRQLLPVFLVWRTSPLSQIGTQFPHREAVRNSGSRVRAPDAWSYEPPTDFACFSWWFGAWWLGTPKVPNPFS